MLNFILILFVFATGEAKVIQTATVETVLPFIDQDTWILVDLDNTTFEGKQALGHTDWFYDKVHRLMNEGMSLEDSTRECYPEWIEVQKLCPVKPIEEAFIRALIQFQRQGNIVMGLTHRQPSIADSTLRQLNSLGLNFLSSAPIKNSLVVSSATPTLFEEGVMFTGEYNKKGEILVRFLSIIDKLPKKIVFFDDKISHVQDVESALAELDVEYLGVHYTACEHVEKVYSPEIAEFQLKMTKTILSNEQALLLMDSR